MSRLLSFSLAAATALFTLAVSRPSRACGGTFCDGQPPPSAPVVMPVDQTGENILFVFDEGSVEAHVQIQYTGDPERFAWIVPMHGVPEIGVGSQQLFANLLASTVPTFVYQQVYDQCGNGSNGGGVGCGASGADSDESGKSSTPAAPAGQNGYADAGAPNVVLQKAVGSFDVTVLSGGTVEGVPGWLSENGYQANSAADPILGEYLDEGYVFVAVRLRSGKGVGEIHPLVFRYPGSEPCIPIRLTRIAAVEDMAIRAFFLASEQAAPTNYRHVVPSDAAFDWVTGAANYTQVIGRAVDAPTADGHAFVTEYAGASSVVGRTGLVDPRWSAYAFEGASPAGAISLLTGQGLLECKGGSCTSPSPLVLPLLQEQIPPPAGATPSQLYSCPQCYSAYLATLPWSGHAFAEAFQDRISGPGEHALEILDEKPYLTRLFTTLSPAEMTEDPEFQLRRDLPDVSNVRTGTLRTKCSGKSGFILPSGRQVALDSLQMWPSVAGMPASDRVEDTSGSAAPVVVHDDGPAISASLEAYNDARDWSSKAEFDTQGDSGCACTIRQGAPTRGLLLLAAAALALRRKKRASSR
jgi:hypothetical protein